MQNSNVTSERRTRTIVCDPIFIEMEVSYYSLFISYNDLRFEEDQRDWSPRFVMKYVIYNPLESLHIECMHRS